MVSCLGTHLDYVCAFFLALQPQRLHGFVCFLEGLSTAIAPLYLSEVAPTNLRGAAGTINQVAIVVGVLVADVLGLDGIMGNSRVWPYLLGQYKFLILMTMFKPQHKVN